VATTSSPLAIYAAQDQTRAAMVLQNIGGMPAVAVSSGDLAQPVQGIASLQTRIEGSNPIVLLVSAASSSSALFQSIALYAQAGSKRLIVIDLDDAGDTNVTGNIKNYSDTVICSSDPGLDSILDAPDRWTLPSGEPYPETGIKHQPKC
jgi:hypothetical protein